MDTCLLRVFPVTVTSTEETLSLSVLWQTDPLKGMITWTGLLVALKAILLSNAGLTVIILMEEPKQDQPRSQQAETLTETPTFNGP